MVGIDWVWVVGVWVDVPQRLRPYLDVLILVNLLSQNWMPLVFFKHTNGLAA